MADLLGYLGVLTASDHSTFGDRLQISERRVGRLFGDRIVSAEQRQRVYRTRLGLTKLAGGDKEAFNFVTVRSLLSRMEKRIVSQTAEVWLGEDGIIRIEIRNPREHTLQDAKDNVDAVRRAGGGTRRPLLSRVAAPGPMTAEARAYYASDDAARALTALAMVTNSILGRIVANLLIGLNSTPVPMRLFGSEEAALQWIRSLGRTSLRPKPRASQPSL